jgi:hypothetical protein
MRIGITGHQHLEDSKEWQWVESELDNIIRDLATPLVGVTSLAIGADQLFANVVIRNGGNIEVVIPFSGYERNYKAGEELRSYDRLLKCARVIDVLTHTSSHQEAYLEAGKRVVDTSDELIAVWDGKPAQGVGGTGDIVDYARKTGKHGFHVNPLLRITTIW